MLKEQWVGFFPDRSLGESIADSGGLHLMSLYTKSPIVGDRIFNHRKDIVI